MPWFRNVLQAVFGRGDASCPNGCVARGQAAAYHPADRTDASQPQVRTKFFEIGRLNSPIWCLGTVARGKLAVGRGD